MSPAGSSVLAEKAEEWIQEDVEDRQEIQQQEETRRRRRKPASKRKVRPAQLKSSAKNKQSPSRRPTTSSASTRSQRPVYRQYLYDRVSGNSYVPRVERGKYLVRKASTQSSSGGEDREEDGPSSRSDNNVPNNEEEAEDPTDCGNRPPHFLCYLPPCVRRCPGFFEQNRICGWAGKIGVHSYFKNHHYARRRIFAVGFIFNTVALLLTIVTAMAFSLDYHILTSTSFTRGTVWVPQFSNETKATINIGIRAVALDDPGKILGGKGNSVSTFNNFCEDAVVGEIETYLSSDLCAECRTSSHQFVLSILINLILIIRNTLSDITRMYPKYDANCPNFSGSLMATMSVFLGLWTIVTYRNRCFRIVEEDARPFYVPSNFTGDGTSGDTMLKVEFEWSNGPGLDCLVAATLLRFVDAICNYIVPTPSITRTPAEQEQYELEFGENESQAFTAERSDDEDSAVGSISEPDPEEETPQTPQRRQFPKPLPLQERERSGFSSSDDDFDEELFLNEEDETEHNDSRFFV